MITFVGRVLRPAIVLLIALTVITGAAYPALVTAVAQVVFPSQANGSMIVVDGKTIGSSLIGQAFSDPKYFWGRPSAAGQNGYDASGSAGSNLGPTDPRLVGFIPGVNTVGLDGSTSATNPFATPADPSCVPTDSNGNAVVSPSTGQTYAMNPDGTYVCYANTILERAIAYRKANGLAPDASVPVDLVTTSASGLDPDISPAAAASQVARVAAARGMSVADVQAAVDRHTQQPMLGFLGQARVNVLLLNLDLDGLLR
jgi:K+-transporting ATPase ATPase C chain